MKNKILKFATAVVFLAFAACGKDDPAPDPNEAFSDLSDVTTTSVETTIPNVEVTQSGNEITVLLSVTDQEGKPLQQFTLGNYEVQMTVGSAAESILKSKIVLAELNEQSNGNPLAAAATLDYSGSMSSLARADMEAALRVFIGLKAPNDQISVIKFGSRVEQVQGFTTDAMLLNRAIDSTLSLGGSTAFYISCELGLDEAVKLSGVLPIVLGFTDGGDNFSNITLAELTVKALSMGIPIYGIGFGSAERSKMQTLADDTGGRFYFAPNSEDIADLYAIINGQLKKLYILKWDTDLSPGTEVTLRITTEYTAANGTFTDVSTKTITIQ